MVVFIIGEGLFNDRGGRGTGVTTTFRAAGLLVARGPLHAEWALVPLAVNPNVFEDTTLETGLMVKRMVLGQRSEDDGSAGNSFFFGCHGSTGSPSALMRRVLRRGVTVLEGAEILARGTGSCT